MSLLPWNWVYWLLRMLICIYSFIAFCPNLFKKALSRKYWLVIWYLRTWFSLLCETDYLSRWLRTSPLAEALSGLGIRTSHRCGWFRRHTFVPLWSCRPSVCSLSVSMTRAWSGLLFLSLDYFADTRAAGSSQPCEIILCRSECRLQGC